MATQYAHLSPEWPNYYWDYAALDDALSQIHFKRGALSTAMATLGFEVRQEAVLQVLVQDITKSSEIEGERLDAQQVRSSIARHLGLEYAGLPTPARDVDGVVEMMLDATQNYQNPLDEERILAWHSALFPYGRSGLYKIQVGAWRNDADGPMQVASGPIGKQTVHFEAPAAARLPFEMARFLRWFKEKRMDPVLKAAVAHLWFVTVHPLDDGNGRVGRAIMDMALARADGTSQRFYSMTAQIHQDRNSYYNILEQTQKRSLDITEWNTWFLDRIAAALDSAENVLLIVRRKQAFWDKHANDKLNDRQTKMLNLLMENFQGKLQTSKYAKIAKCSPDTALRDLTDLVTKHILIREEGGGRSTSYILAPT
jgi:Fic family protein